MKLQNLTIIFIIIALPVILLLSVYIRYQVDTANLRASYDNKFLGATYDMLTTFQLNTTNNKYSSVSSSLIRDIQASINVFSSSFGNSVKLMGSSKNDVMTFVPALLFTLHDGYYIYTPIADNDGNYKHELKPYVFYTKEYTNGTKTLIINFSIDNYIVAYYKDSTIGHEKYESKAGYLEPIANSEAQDGVYVSSDKSRVYYNKKEIAGNETRNETIYISDYNETTATVETNAEQTEEAFDYYLKAYVFTKWFNEVLDEINMPELNVLKVTSTNQALPEKESAFNSEKEKVIKNSIESNLIQAMQAYKRKIGIDFRMPQLTVLDWEKITKNVCIISFIQGIPVGTTTYNNYFILPSSENKMTVNDQTLYYIGYGQDADGCYHRLGCDHLKGTTITRVQQG